MNSYVSVEENVPCEEFENLVFSASNITTGCDSVKKSVNFDFANNLSSCSSSSTLISEDYLICVPSSETNAYRKENDFVSSKNLDNLGSISKLLPVNEEENYKNCSAVDIEVLPFETVLMNYPGKVDYLDLNKKFLNSKFGNSPNPFESDNETGSFDGFSDSDSSFEGFNETRSKKKYFIKNRESVIGLSKSHKSNSNSLENESQSKKILRSKSLETDSNPKPNNSGKHTRLSIDFKNPKNSEDKQKQASKLVEKVSCVPSKSRSLVGSIFGDYKVTPLSSKLNTSAVKTARLDFSLETPSRPSLQTRSFAEVERDSQKTSQNYSESVASSFYPSAISKFKEKDNEATGGMQQKSQKEKLEQVQVKNSHSHVQIKDKEVQMLDPFVEDSEDESFEGFQDNSENSNVIEQVKNLEDFIGPKCNEIGCAISWLESGKAKEISQIITNGIVFELNEFAKKICWEPEFVAEWICRLQSYKNVKATDDDLRKINSILKRRKAISVNFAGLNTLKSKLSIFDAEIFLLPSIENIKNNIEKVVTSSLSENEIMKIKPDIKKSIDNEKYKAINKDNKLLNTKTVKEPECISSSGDEMTENLVMHDKESITNSKSLADSTNAEHSESLNSETSDEELNDIEDDSDQSIKKFENQPANTFSKLPNTEHRVSSRIRKPTTKLHNESLNSETSDEELNDIEDDSDQSIKKFENQLANTFSKLPNTEHRVSGRIRKPTTKLQESYSLKHISTLQNNNEMHNDNLATDNHSAENLKSKYLSNIFKDDGKEIGPNCTANSITVELLNSMNEASYPITNGVVYELYHFFRERKASLTSLVHTLYRLKKIPFDKSNIIATMATIHEMVKVMWKENIDKNPNMPCEEFNLLISENLENKSRGKRTRSLLSSDLEINNKNMENNELEPACKRRKLLCNKKSYSNEYPESSESDSNSESTSALLKENTLSSSFDLNSTKGYLGKITRGDIVYLYTKWLKKKMEGQSNVFVTDLSKDVEDLITERKVECIRIPVGTLMSSSVKLFDEFRKLSRVNMHQAKTFLLEDWIEDINPKLNPSKKRIISEQRCEDNQLSERNSDSSILSSTDTGNKINKFPNFPDENSVKGTPEEPLNSIVKKDLISNITNECEHEVEKIVGYRIVKIGEGSVTEYRIRWSGLSSKEDSWINESDLNCPDNLAKFWEALNKQRALKGRTEPGLSTQHISPVKEPTTNISFMKNSSANDSFVGHSTDDVSINKSIISSPVKIASNINHTIQQPHVTETKTKSFINGQENTSPFFGRENGSQKFFNIMINNLKPDLVDYQHEDEPSFARRVKVSKGDILQIYDEWRFENQEHLLTGGNQKVDVHVLIARVKDLMEKKKVRNFNPSCIIDSCYRLALMRAKLKDASKIKEYLTGDFLEFIQISQKHQDYVRSEYANKLKKLKQTKAHITSECDKLNKKINTINNLERESLIIAKYLNANKNMKEKTLGNKVLHLQNSLQSDNKDQSLIENIKKQNSHIIKELESYGISDDAMDELLNIALKVKV